MANHLPDFKSFDITLEPTSLGVQWDKWIKRLENLFIGMNLGDDADSQKKALLLYYAGEDVSEIYDTLEDTSTTYDGAKSVLTTYFKPKKNLTFEVYKFRSIKQDDTGKKNVHAKETIDQYVARLRTAATRCEFGDVDREIRDQIVFNCKSDSLRRKALRDDLDLTVLLKLGRSIEVSESQAQKIEEVKNPVEQYEVNAL